MQKKLPDKTNSFFFALCIDTTIASILDIINCLISYESFKYHLWVNWFIQCSYFLTVNFLPVLFLLYCMALTQRIKHISGVLLKFLFFVPYIINIILVVSSPRTEWVFSIHPSRLYFRNSGIFIIYLISCYYLIFGTVLLIKFNTTIDKRKQFTAYIFAIFSTGAMIVQIILPNLRMQSFIISLCLFLLFTSLETTEQMLEGVTMLFNQKAFDIMSSRLFNLKKEFYIIGIIIDDLPFLNNTFGIPNINVILQNISQFLQKTAGINRVYYLNQGEFCIIMQSFDTLETEKLLETIKLKFSHSWIENLFEVKLSTRFCVISCPNDAISSVEVIDTITTIATDNRYKQEKLIYAKNINTYDLKRISYVEQELKTAIQDGRVEVYYQPLFSTKENRIIGAEALVRVKDSNGAFISPEEFVPIAERNGSILRIGLFVFDHVCQFVSSTKIERYGINIIDINLSVAQCMQNSLSNQLIEIMQIYNLAPKLINLEITETAAAHTPDMLKINMEKLSNFGFEFSLDDYGSGYANINYILHFPFSMIKIDKDIIWTAFKDERAYYVMTGIIDMMKNLKMKIVAEGIETKEMSDTLTKLGCDYLQGYYFSEPLPEKDFFKIVKKNAEDLQIMTSSNQDFDDDIIEELKEITDE